MSCSGSTARTLAPTSSVRMVGRATKVHAPVASGGAVAAHDDHRRMIGAAAVNRGAEPAEAEKEIVLDCAGGQARQASYGRVYEGIVDDGKVQDAINEDGRGAGVVGAAVFVEGESGDRYAIACPSVGRACDENERP